MKIGIYVLIVVLGFSVGFLLVNMLLGCHDGCAPEETRCSGTRVEICDQDEDWDLVLDCAKLEPSDGSICCWDEELAAHSCLPEELCSAEGANPLLLPLPLSQ